MDCVNARRCPPKPTVLRELRRDGVPAHVLARASTEEPIGKTHRPRLLAYCDVSLEVNFQREGHRNRFIARFALGHLDCHQKASSPQQHEQLNNEGSLFDRFET